MNYSKWSPALLKVEREFYSSFDPRIWVLAALQFNEPAKNDLTIDFGSGENDLHTADELLSDFESTRRLFRRQFRYQSCELLMSMMLSVQTNMPYLRFATKTKADRLNRKFSEIAEGVVPIDLVKTETGQKFTFDEWVEYALTGVIGGDLCETTAAFIRQEAKLIADRSAINAMKHGRAAVDLDNGEMKFQVKSESQYVNLVKPSPIISFFTWKEEADHDVNRFEVTRSFETVDKDYDFFAIHTVSLLMNLMKRSRLSMLGVAQKNVIVPSKIALEKSFVRGKGLPLPSTET